MDSSFALLALIGAALGVIAFRNGKNADLFTFPFLFPAVTVAFVLVEFSDFILNAGVLYEIYSDTGVIMVALFMIASCSLLGLAGHWIGSRKTTHSQAAPKNLAPPSERDIRYLHISSLVLGGLSFGAFLWLTTLSGGFQDYIFASAAYSLEWRGLPVYLVFVVQFCYVSIAIQLWLWVRTRRSRHLRWALVFSTIPLINIVFVFRRFEVIKLGLVFGYFLTNYHKLKIGRFPALMAIVAMYAVLKIFPLLRNEAGKDLGVDELVSNALQRDSFQESEIGSGLLRIFQSMQFDDFEYGAIFYNAVIGQFVPAGLVGAELKAALMLPTVAQINTSFSEFRFYLSPMGFAQAYQQFWLLGGLIFFALGYLMAQLERDRFFNMRRELLYVTILPVTVSTVSADLSLIAPQMITALALILIAVPATRSRAPRPIAGRPGYSV